MIIFVMALLLLSKRLFHKQVFKMGSSYKYLLSHCVLITWIRKLAKWILHFKIVKSYGAFTPLIYEWFTTMVNPNSCSEAHRPCWFKKGKKFCILETYSRKKKISALNFEHIIQRYPVSLSITEAFPSRVPSNQMQSGSEQSRARAEQSYYWGNHFVRISDSRNDCGLRRE